MWFKRKYPHQVRLQKRVSQELSGLLFMAPKFIQGGYDPWERKTKDFSGHRGLIWAEFLLNRVLTSLLSCLLAVNHLPVFEKHLWGASESQCDFHLHTRLLKASLSISCQWAAIAGRKRWILFLLWFPLAFSSNPASSVCLFVRQQGGWASASLHLSLWLCSQSKICNVPSFTVQMCPAGGCIPSNKHSFHGPHPRLCCQLSP